MTHVPFCYSFYRILSSFAGKCDYSTLSFNQFLSKAVLTFLYRFQSATENHHRYVTLGSTSYRLGNENYLIEKNR